MSSLTATLIGLGGSALVILAFVYANLVGAMDKRLFNLMNLLGSILLLVSLSVDFNLASVVLESTWGVVALGGLIAALRGKAH